MKIYYTGLAVSIAIEPVGDCKIGDTLPDERLDWDVWIEGSSPYHSSKSWITVTNPEGESRRALITVTYEA